MDSNWRQALTEYFELQQQFDEIRKAGVLRVRDLHAPIDFVRERWDQSGPHSLEESRAMSQLLKEYGRRRREHGLKMANFADSLILRSEENRVEMLALCNESEAEPIEVVQKMRDHLKQQIELFSSFDESIFDYDELVDRCKSLMEKKESALDSLPRKKKSRWR